MLAQKGSRGQVEQRTAREERRKGGKERKMVRSVRKEPWTNVPSTVLWNSYKC